MIGGLADADHRCRGEAAGGIEPGVVEAGDDVAVDAAPLALGDCHEQPGNRSASSKNPSIEAGPSSSSVATISVPAAAAPRAAAAIFAVIERVVLGLTTRMRIGRQPASRRARWKRSTVMVARR